MSWFRKEERGDWVPSQMEGLAIKHGNGTNHGACGSWWASSIRTQLSPVLHQNLFSTASFILPYISH